ncbi:MAG: hypothetical protein ACFFAS_01450 [Promethearchaeota archaeon]
MGTILTYRSPSLMRVFTGGNCECLGKWMKTSLMRSCWLVKTTTNSPPFSLYLGGRGRPLNRSGWDFLSFIA